MTNLLKMLQKVTLSFSLAQETQKEVVRFKKQLWANTVLKKQLKTPYKLV